MALLPIKIIPDKNLRKKSERIKIAELKDEKFKQLLLDMEETMIKKDGIGLAAPQVGINKRLVVINTKDGAIVLINPRILFKSIKREIDNEGCLSVPNVWGLVRRSTKIKVFAINKIGKKVLINANGLLARVILHEVDHVNGILFIDKAIKITQGKEKLDEYLSKK